jgi:hypothetical protein
MMRTAISSFEKDFNLLGYDAVLSMATLWTQAASCSATLVTIYHSKWSHILENLNHQHSLQDLKSCPL